MITRLKVDGFKNLVNVDVHFGAFNVITGANGVGKSNLFDALRFLNYLCLYRIEEAAKKIRGAEKNARNIFSKLKSDSGQSIRIEIFFDGMLSIDGILKLNKMSYEIELKWDDEKKKIVKSREFTKWIKFDDINDSEIPWITTGKPEIGIPEDYSVLSAPVWYTENEDRPLRRFYEQLLIQGTLKDGLKYFNFVPEDLRKDSGLSSYSWISESGNNLPGFMSWVYLINPESRRRIPRFLFDLDEKIVDINIREDSSFESSMIEVKMEDSNIYSARSLSDGTLRMISLLGVMEFSSEQPMSLLIEEPENGFYPRKINSLVRIIRGYCGKKSEKDGMQVIINTHSPALVSQASDEDIIVVNPVSSVDNEGNSFIKPKFYGLKGTWREKAGMPVVPISSVLDYLDPIPQRYADEPLRLIDRDDARRLVERHRQHTWEVTED